MNKLRRFYNQNTKEIWIGIVIIIFIISIIQLFNNFAAKENQEKIEESKNEEQVETKYGKESETIILGRDISEKTKDTYGEIMDQFLTHCVKQEVEQAYNFLSKDCKEMMYPSQEVFKTEYCETKFSGNKTYSFQSWTNVREVIYYVKIFDDMLSTGIANTRNYKEDYITIVKENDEYKLNINSYITKKERNVEEEKENIKIKVNDTKVYMDYELYSITISNYSDKDILLDSREKTDTVYVKDENGATYEALLYENEEEDLIVRAGKKKTITIKFSNSYQAGTRMKMISFSDIILDKEQYNERLEIQVGW